MSYFEIGIYHPTTETNVGTLWRSAIQLGAAGVFTIGRRYRPQAGDTAKTILSVPLRHHLTFENFLSARPVGAELVAVEMGGKPLGQFVHFRCAVYLLGAEDHGLPKGIVERCQRTVSIEAIGTQSYNVAVAGSLVMWHRQFGPKAVSNELAQYLRHVASP